MHVWVGASVVGAAFPLVLLRGPIGIRLVYFLFFCSFVARTPGLLLGLFCGVCRAISYFHQHILGGLAFIGAAIPHVTRGRWASLSRTFALWVEYLFPVVSALRRS